MKMTTYDRSSTVELSEAKNHCQRVMIIMKEFCDLQVSLGVNPNPNHPSSVILSH